jgi:uncharacterized protein (DUF362 family)
MRINNMEKVIIRKIPGYDQEYINEFAVSAMDELGVKPQEKAFIKPNLVHATRYGEHAYTHPEFMRGVLHSLKERGVQEQIIFEDCGLMVPLRYVYRKSGYKKLCREEKAKFLNLSEAVHDGLLNVPDHKVHPFLPLPKTLTDNGLRVFVPKLKVHSQTDITGASKLLIGLIKRSIRLNRHHYDLGNKISDALRAFPPDLVLIDAITIGVNGVGCPDPRNLGLAIASRNAVAADSVAAWLLGFDSRTIEHLVLASKRGLGPASLKDIEIINPDNVKPAPFGYYNEKPIAELNPYMKYFEGRLHNGKRCRGGCVGFVAEAIHYINHYRTWRETEKINPAAKALFWLLGQEPSQERPRKLGIVVGEYDGQIPQDVRDNLIFVGDCTHAKGIKPGLHLKGCPVYMARKAFAFSRKARIINPYIDVMEGLPFIRAFLEEQFMRVWNQATHFLRRNV